MSEDSGKLTIVEQYGRIQIDVGKKCRSVTVAAPSGKTEEVMTFVYQPTHLLYDRHGYEYEILTGEPFTAFRYTPEETGVYAYRAGKTEGRFECVPSKRSGYVGVSEKDRRYFAAADGSCFVPMGLNLCLLRYDTLPAGEEHFALGSGRACRGMKLYRRWIRQLHEAGGNYFRLWLSSEYLDARSELPGKHDLRVFNRLDQIMELAREYDMRVKLCFEHFRTIDGSGGFFDKRLIDPETGSRLTNLDEWLTSEKWNELWLEDVKPYIARYYNDPAVFAWELWNEMPCLRGKRENVDAFAERMAEKIKAMSPKNMMCNSQGSFDNMLSTEDLKRYRDTPVYDFGTVHRYLDQGAELGICRSGCVASLAADAICQLRCKHKPIVLNETGAVNDRHTGPFRYYSEDHDGMLFWDFTYTPFFAGSAACGHLWHWEYYVDPQNLWRCYRPFAEMLKGVEADEEQFEPDMQNGADARVYILRGKKHTLVYVRGSSDNWMDVLRDEKTPRPVRNLSVPVKAEKAEVWWLMNERGGSVECGSENVVLPEFTHGCMMKLTNRIE